MVLGDGGAGDCGTDRVFVLVFGGVRFVGGEGRKEEEEEGGRKRRKEDEEVHRK